MSGRRKDLVERLVVAALDVIKDGDPVLVIVVGSNSVRVEWEGDVCPAIIASLKEDSDG